MKIKAAWIEYIINPVKKRNEKGIFYALTYRSSRESGVQNWHGLIQEEEIKELLSTKQFNEWKAGKRNSFIKHLTVQERKNILKLNNKKNNE